MQENEKQGSSAITRAATFIVDKRSLIFLLTIILMIFSLVAQSWVEVENDLTAYLPEDNATRQALDIMEEQFITYGTAEVMVSSISLDEAWDLQEELEDLDGVMIADFDDTADHYNNASALFSLTFTEDEDDEACLETLENVQEALEGYDIFVSTELGDQEAELIDEEVSRIMVIAVVIVVLVLLLTSETWAEVIVMLLTFVVAMVINKGTNFIFGEISFVSNSVTTILQLALSLDYAVIFCNHFREEHESLPQREAVIAALTKSITEISSSCLTTIGGLAAMTCMQFEIGMDLGLCLIKSILFAILSVFLVMPGLLMVFGPLMDRTKHRSLMPSISFAGKFAWATRRIVPPVFLVVVVAAFLLSSDTPYLYGYSGVETPQQNDVQLAEEMIEENFGSSNMVALMVPAGDYESEAALLADLEAFDEVDSAMGLANIEAMDGYTLTDALTARQFAELADIDYELAQLVYTAYAAEQEAYAELLGSNSGYSVPLLDMILYICDLLDSGLVELDEEQADSLDAAKEQMEMARDQLQGEDYSRILLYLNLPASGDETYDFLDTIRETAEEYYDADGIWLAGDSTSEAEFREMFATDNIVVSVLSILIVLVLLLFTFRSVAMPLLLILVIQGSIWINFSFLTVLDSPVFFMSYLVVSSIQMGANIDYAIVLASRYEELRHTMPRREAMIEAINFAFKTVFTSGSILAVAGGLIGQMTSEVAIVGIGQCLCRGTIISIVLVLFVLPQILLIGGGVVDATTFSIRHITTAETKKASGTIRVDGMVSGQVSGVIHGMVRGTIEGDVDLKLISGSLTSSAEGAADSGGSDAGTDAADRKEADGDAAEE